MQWWAGGYLHSVLKFNNFMEQSSDDARKLLSLQTINALGGVIDDGDFQTATRHGCFCTWYISCSFR